MPLTSKGEKIKSAMTEKYGAEKGEEVFYASKNKGTITGVDSMPATAAKPAADKKKDQAPAAGGAKPEPQAEAPVKETKTTVKEPAGGGEPEQDPKSTLKAAEDELKALEREQEQSEEGLSRQNAIDDQKQIIRNLRNEMRETEHKERMGIADALDREEYKEDGKLLLKHVADRIDSISSRMDAFAAKKGIKDYAPAQSR